MATSRHARLALPLRMLTLLGLWCMCAAQTRYQGREIGALSQLQHGVRGRVFAVDARTIHVHDLHYDGEGPAAYFYVGKSKAPTAEGAHRLRDERGGAGALRKYRGESVTLALPDGLSLKDVRWFAIYCDEYAVNFGDVRIPRELEYPRPAKLGALRGVHGVWSEPVVVVDAQTLLVPHFSYDGEAPDAKFWVGRGESPSPQGIRIPDENGKETPLRKYDKKTIVLTLPGELTVFDIGHFGVWCEAFTVDFGHVPLPRAALRNVPPSLKMLGVSPQSRNMALAGATEAPTPPSRRPRPSARLDATTYRPHLRPGTGPLQALAEQPSDHSALHRRADTYTPSPEQTLVDQGEVKDEQNGSPSVAEQNDDQEKQQATMPTPSQETEYRLLSDSHTEVRPDYYTQQQAPQAHEQAHQHTLQQVPQPAHQQQEQAFEQQRHQQREHQPRVEVQPPELLELQYFPSEPEYYPQARQFSQQDYFPQQQQHRPQPAGPFQYPLVSFDRGFAY